jgi:hypothetical protein
VFFALALSFIGGFAELAATQVFVEVFAGEQRHLSSVEHFEELEHILSAELHAASHRRLEALDIENLWRCEFSRVHGQSPQGDSDGRRHRDFLGRLGKQSPRNDRFAPNLLTRLRGDDIHGFPAILG